MYCRCAVRDWEGGWMDIQYRLFVITPDIVFYMIGKDKDTNSHLSHTLIFKY